MKIYSNQYNADSDIIIKNIFSVNHDIRTKEWNYKWRAYSHYEMHYIMRGGIAVNFENNTTYHNSDSLFFYTPALPGTSFPTELPTEIISVYFDAEIPDRLNNVFSEFFYISECAPVLRSAFRNIKQIYYSKQTNYQLKIKKEIYDILAVISDKLNEINNENANYYTVRAAETYIREKYLKEDISIDFLANLCKITPAYFSRVFREIYGMSPKKYIIDLKMQIAEELLEYTMTPISEIAQKLGYSELPYFTSAFKKHFGVSPSQFRKK